MGSTHSDRLDSLQKTPLHALHVAQGARMVPFAGFEMPVQYPRGIIAEHTHTRTAASLFDVSHMGQAVLVADGDAGALLERLVPGDIEGLAPGAMRYSLLLNDAGGIIDDLMITRLPAQNGASTLFLVVNASRKAVDFAHIEAGLAGDATLSPMPGAALLALQGPQAARVLTRLAPEIGRLAFLHGREVVLGGEQCFVTRSGYTGEDGFEISIAGEAAASLAQRLLDEPEVALAGLGARDSLRLEAGLCLYGNDIDEETSPIEAGLAWTVSKRRREEGGFPGAARILRELAEGARRRRVGLLPEGRAPVRGGASITDTQGTEIGRVTSGGFGPTLGRPLAMGYVDAAHRALGAKLRLVLRGRRVAAEVVRMPFVSPNYHRGS